MSSHPPQVACRAKQVTAQLIDVSDACIDENETDSKRKKESKAERNGFYLREGLHTSTTLGQFYGRKSILCTAVEVYIRLRTLLRE